MQMQGCKVLKIDGVYSKLAVFEIRDGKYWDGKPATKMEDDTTLVPDGFYFCELTSDGYIAKADDGGEAIYGPHKTAKAAERAAREGPTYIKQIIAELVRQGCVRSMVGEDGVLRFQALELPPEELEQALRSAAAALKAGA
jgi:hypothetical protein